MYSICVKSYKVLLIHINCNIILLYILIKNRFLNVFYDENPTKTSKSMYVKQPTSSYTNSYDLQHYFTVHSCKKKCVFNAVHDENLIKCVKKYTFRIL